MKTSVKKAALFDWMIFLHGATLRESKFRLFQVVPNLMKTNKFQTVNMLILILIQQIFRKN